MPEGAPWALIDYISGRNEEWYHGKAAAQGISQCYPSDIRHQVLLIRSTTAKLAQDRTVSRYSHFRLHLSTQTHNVNNNLKNVAVPSSINTSVAIREAKKIIYLYNYR